MNELTLTQIGALIGILYTFYQMSQAKAAHVATVATLKTRIDTLENQMRSQDQVIVRIEHKVNQLCTVMARLEERISALDAKLS
tara:strand:- start:132 stop:383 length:252 start_codon:yes stop_codon:yes gene_type:complete